jgi:glucose-6-phosphate dehydrogenase assembly protein OpcA
VADALAVDSWEGNGVRLGEVVAALADLRHRSATRSAIRTAVMTLVVVAGGDGGAERAVRAVHALGAHHPARVVLVRADADQAATLDARAELFSTGAKVDGDGHPVAFDEVTLFVGGQAALHLNSLVDVFTLADLPVVVWYTDALPDPADSLLSIAEAVIVDSRDTCDAVAFRRLLELARRRTVVDLSWIRLQAVRDLLGGLFDPPALRPYVGAVTKATVKGKSGPRHLLGGWLMAQLRIASHQVQLVDARHVEVTLEAHLDGEVGTFDVGRLEARRAVWAGATVSSGPSPRQVLPLPDDGLTAALGNALTRLQPDGVWERALAAAGSLAV